jgi:hypothetical protein
MAINIDWNRCKWLFLGFPSSKRRAIVLIPQGQHITSSWHKRLRERWREMERERKVNNKEKKINNNSNIMEVNYKETKKKIHMYYLYTYIVLYGIV